MPPEMNERQLQAAAHRCGLKIVLDRYSAAATGCRRYFLRPIWDARQAVRALPDGGYELVKILANGRRMKSNSSSAVGSNPSHALPRACPGRPAWWPTLGRRLRAAVGRGRGPGAWEAPGPLGGSVRAEGHAHTKPRKHTNLPAYG
jgi:hypothetical protein